MKKFSTLLFATSFAMAAWAEAPVLLFRDEPVESGKTYEAGYTYDEMDLGGGFIVKSYTQDSHLTLSGTKDAMTVLEVKASESVQVCGIDGQCMVGENVTKKGKLGMSDVIAENGDNVTIDLRIERLNDDYTGMEDPATFVPTITLDVTAYYAASPNDKATTKVTLRNVPDSELGIKAVGNDFATISLGYGNTLEYNAIQPVKLDIYNVNGSLVMSKKIYSTGSISLDTLHPGVYIYSAAGKAGKILVRK